jgi:hypothetical protein
MNNGKQTLKGTLCTLVFILLIHTLFGQKKPLKNNDFRDIDKFVLLYADSLNKCVIKDNIIPCFLYDSNFDLNLLYWAGMHKPISLRYLVLQKVQSTEVLDFIIERANTNKLKTYPSTDSPLPFRKYSFYDLIIYRLSELRTIENYKQFKKEVKAP